MGTCLSGGILLLKAATLKKKGGAFFVGFGFCCCLRIYWMIVRLEGLKGIILFQSCDPLETLVEETAKTLTQDSITF